MIALIRHFTLFCGVGAINTILSLLVILFLLKIVGLHYMLANLAGYLFGLGLGYILHSRVTFRAQKQESKQNEKAHFRQFILIFCVAYLCQLLLLYALVEIMQFHDGLSQVLAVGMYTVMNFIGNKYWTFR